MLNLNLLPPAQRNNLNYEINRRIAQFLGFWLLCIGIIFGILIAPAYFLVALQQSEVERARRAEETVQNVKKFRELGEEIRNINQLLQIMVRREETKRDVSPFIAEVFEKVPVGVSINLLTLDPPQKKALLQGQAATRTALLRFIEILRTSPRIRSVSSPITNIIKEENITYSLSFETNL